MTTYSEHQLKRSMIASSDETGPTEATHSTAKNSSTNTATSTTKNTAPSSAASVANSDNRESVVASSTQSTYSQSSSNDVHQPKASQASPGRIRHVMDTLSKFATVSEVLRILGAIVIAGSLSLFMLQGWQDGNDVQRYLKLLLETMLLTAGGFGLSAWLKEHKGARLFFGLGLASVAANFTILSALIYSRVQLDGLAVSYPDYAAWTSQSPLQILMVTLLALAILIPVTRLAFAILARPAARWLTVTYLVGNALLLLPVRSSVWSSLLAVMLVAFIVWNISRNRNDDRAPGTTESKFSMLILLLPAVILCVRSFYFYSVEMFAIACMAAAAFVLVRHIALRTPHLNLQRMLDTLSLPLPLVAAGAMTIGLEQTVGYASLLPIFAFVLMPMMAELTIRRPKTMRSGLFGIIGGLLICTALVLNQFMFQSFAVALTGLLGTGLVALAGYWLNRHLLRFTGLAAFSIIAAVNLTNFLQWFDVNNWVLLSVLGASAIVIASLLDRYGAALKLKLDALREQSSFA